MRALLKRNDPWKYVLFVRNESDFLDLSLSNNFPASAKATAGWQFSIFNYPFYSWEEQLYFPSLIKRSKIDLLHVPHFNVPLFCPCPFFVTIHDLILHHYPNQASITKRIAYRILMNHAVKHSAHIFAVSAFTANEITQTYGEDLGKKMTVTHEGVSERFRLSSEEEKNRIRTKYNLPSSFLLYIGASKEHKNIQTLIAAVPEGQTLLLITGGKEVKRLSRRSNVRILSNVDDDDLPILMSAARLYIQPSLYEGFGLPVLEAMACGTTVVASNRTSIPEITQGNAVLVEPTKEGLTEGIRGALSLSNDSVKAAEHARTFTWGKTAETVSKQYADFFTSHSY